MSKHKEPSEVDRSMVAAFLSEFWHAGKLTFGLTALPIASAIGVIGAILRGGPVGEAVLFAVPVSLACITLLTLNVRSRQATMRRMARQQDATAPE